MLLSAACTTAPVVHRVDGHALSGRMSVKVDAGPETPARSMSAIFELRGNEREGALELATPLGTVLAQARWSPSTVSLVTPDGKRQYADLGALTRDVLGEAIPVAALFDWLQGRPWPGAPSVQHTPISQHGFEQAGWRVDLAQFSDARITVHRAAPPAVTVRAKLDR